MKNIFLAARYTSYAVMGITLLGVILSVIEIFGVTSSTIGVLWRIATLLLYFVSILFWGNFCWQCNKKAPIHPPAAILCAAFICHLIISILKFANAIPPFSAVGIITTNLPTMCEIVGISMLGRFVPNKTPIKYVVIAIPIFIILPLLIGTITPYLEVVSYKVFNSVSSFISLTTDALWATFYYLFYKLGNQQTVK